MAFLPRRIGEIGVYWGGFKYELDFLVIVGILVVAVCYTIITGAIIRVRNKFRIDRGLVLCAAFILLWIVIVLLVHQGTVSYGDKLAAILLYLIPASSLLLVGFVRMNRGEQFILLNTYVLVGGVIGLLSSLFIYIGPMLEKIFKWQNVHFQGGVVRSFAPLGGPTLVGAFLLLIFPLAVFFSIAEKSPLRRNGYYGIAILSVLGILMSVSRGSIAFVGIQMLWIVVVLRSVGEGKYLSKYLGLMLVTLFLGCGISYKFGYLDFLLLRLNFDTTTPYSSVNLRATSFETVIQYALNHLIFGSGPSRYFSRIHLFSPIQGPYNILDEVVYVEGSISGFHPHSAYLLVLSEFGLPGLVFVVATFAYTANLVRGGIRYAIKKGDRQGKLLLNGLYIGLVTFFAWLLLSDSIFLFHRIAFIFWTYCGLSLNLSFSIQRRYSGRYVL